MSNFDTYATWRYHNSTKHSVESVQAGPHILDWSNKPRPHKLYEHVVALPLPQDLPPSNSPALSSISHMDVSTDGKEMPNLDSLASILHYSSGITKWLRTGGGRTAFRAAACTGALYHIELYVVCGPIPGLDAGVYHYGVHDEALRQLREGDYRGFLVGATGHEASVAEAPVTVVCTSTYWRNSWKYQARAYRHCFWDCGTIVANMLAMASAYRLPAQVVAGFVDDEINRLLDLDDKREVTTALVPLGRAASMKRDPSPEVKGLNLATIPPSSREVDYPPIREMHAASSLATPQ